MATMFDQLGGLGGLVAGKTVAIKPNLVSSPWQRLNDLPVERTHWTHPVVIGAAVYLLGRAGASRIRVVECCGDTMYPLEKAMSEAGWTYQDILNAAPNVEFENTQGLGNAGYYSQIWCPAPHIFPGFSVNHSYTECDVFVSLPKLKEHKWFGVTLSMKNCYGMTPMTIYGDAAGVDEPAVSIGDGGTRVSVMHNGFRAPSLAAPQEMDPTTPRVGDYRLPRIIADIVSARPVHLALIDGVETMCAGEGPWAPGAKPVAPRVMLAGLNPVTTDAVAMALMGFDPKAQRGTPPFDDSDSFMTFAEELKLGTCDLSQIEVRGTQIADAVFDFRAARDPVPAGG
jgi:uncharacterized protein (DUF362 family)